MTLLLGLYNTTLSCC